MNNMNNINSGEIWKSPNPNRPNIEIIRVNIYRRKVYWKYVDNKMDFETPLDIFLKDQVKLE